MSNPSFQSRLRDAARQHDSWLCVGLDPTPERLPAGVDLETFLAGIVAATGDLACCFKPQIAFYEALGMPGQALLRSVLRAIPPHVPVLLDAKRNDTPDTMQAYARALFDELGADAVTVNPYLGPDSLGPFLDYADRGVFVLCKTSNPGSGALQDLVQADGEPLFVHVARQALSWDRHGTVGFVVGATYPRDVARVRAVAPDAPILLPGIGAQAGELERSVQAGVDATGGGLLVSASRSVLYASRGTDWASAARQEADRLRRAINAARADALAAR